MWTRWIKPLLPRSLLWRAILILVIPIIFVQIVVTFVFIERLFGDVSHQLTANTSLKLNFILTAANKSTDIDEAVSVLAQRTVPFAINYEFLTDAQAATEADRKGFFDLSGKYVTETLYKQIDGLKAVDLVSLNGQVRIVVDTAPGPLALSFSRYQASAGNPHQVLVAMALTSILMTSIAIVFLKNQVRPIRRLAKASEAFGKGQSIEFHPQGATEVWSAGRAFLSMRARIERQIEQRTLMLSGVSHDMRTPLTRMKLSLSLMDETPETKMLQRDVEDMESMLREFLEFAKGDNDEKITEVPLQELVEKILENKQRDGLDIELRYLGKANNDITFDCRRIALQRAIENLISNAVRYGAKVRLSVFVQRRHIEFIVEDDGPGIPPDKYTDALRPFSRLDTSRNLNLGGNSGLGLSIAADIARTHGGSLQLDRSADMGGLKVSLKIPR
jgi:two-component system osmolarity sensor histidine kinase EnvZ